MTTLSDVCSHIVDCKNRTAPADENGEYFAVGTPAMRGNKINFSEARRINAEVFEQWTSRLRPQAGDLLLAREAPVGPVVLIPDGGNIAAGQRTTLLRVDSTLADAIFLRHYLTSDSVQARLLANAHGSTTPHLRVDDIRRFEVDLPPLPIQKSIADVLGALDDKIAANTRLAKMVDSVLILDFSARLSRTQSREQTLGAIANVVLGGTPSRARAEYWTDGTIPWLNSGAVNATRIIEPSEFITVEALEKSAAKLMPSGATLLAITGATLGQIARLEMRASGNQSIVGVWSDDVDLNTWLYFAIQARLGNLLARSTGAAQQHVSKGDVEQLSVQLPPQPLLAEFSSAATPLLELAAVAERENRTLAATRDALLPQLMSGKLRVRDAEAIAADAGA